MHSATNIAISHDKIINVMAKIGYEEVKEGVCNGLAQMWTQAVFCGETKKFINRLHFICNEPALIHKIALAKAKHGHYLTAEDQACLDVLAFLDGVQLYQNFRLYTHLLDTKPAYLDAAAISALTLPIKLEKRPIVEIFCENRLFNSVNLQQYLNRLSSELELYAKTSAALEKSNRQPHELVIALHSCSHKIVLRYNVSLACWELTDANQYPPFYLPYFGTATATLQSLTEGILTATNISIFTTADNPLKGVMRTIFEKIQKKDLMASMSATAIAEKQKSLLSLTAMRGDEKNFLRLANQIPNLKLWECMIQASKTAIYNGQRGITNLILDQYPDCFMHSSETQEFLSMAINFHQNDLIEKIIAKGGDTNEPHLGQRPLHIAISAGNFVAVKKLITLGALATLTNTDDELPLSHAIKLHQHDIINYLCSLKNNYVDASNKHGNTALMTAVRENNSSACEILLKHGANPNLANKAEETATHIACELGHEACLAILISHKAHMNLADTRGSTPLSTAILKKHWNIAATILLNLKTLDSFHPNSFVFAMNHLDKIMTHITKQLEMRSDEEKKQFWSDVKHHRNALGQMLMKKPKAACCKFFKQKEKQRQAYKHDINAACKPSTDRESRNGYIRL